MKPHRRQRLILIALMLISVGGAVGLTLHALQQNINLFFTPTQIQEQIAVGNPPRNNFRIGGLVAENSVTRSADNLAVRFVVTDTINSIAVIYRGILPDLFREGQGIVVSGTMRDNQFVARQVLAKHDENYTPPQVESALRDANKYKYGNEKYENEK